MERVARCQIARREGHHSRRDRLHDEHPDLVAERLVRYANVVGRENVIAGTDCGFGTSVRENPLVDPRIAWAKLQSMAEGARRATRQLWGSAASSGR